MKHLCLILIFLVATIIVSAQEIPSDITDQIESFLEEQDEEIDIISLYELLRIFAERPMNINDASYEDIQELRLLSDIQITELLHHIDRFGPLLSIEEMQSIPSFTASDIRRIRLFVQVKGSDNLHISFGDMIKESRNEVYLKWGRILEDKRGYQKDKVGESNYLGNPHKYFVRYRNNYNNKLRMGFILEKDPGEQFGEAGQTLGFDYLTAHIYLKDYSRLLKDLAVGDYTISLGQGLIAHNSFGAGKSAWVTNIKKGGRTINPFNSVNENGYMRGAATTLRFHDNIEWSIYLSQVNRDGNALEIDSFSGAEPELIFTSLQTSGNHRTNSEIEDKGVIGMKSFGTTLKFKKRHYHIALNSLNHRFNSNLQRSDQLYNLFRFDGDRLSNHSIDLAYRYKNYNLFGEAAYSSSGGMAYLAGALIALDKRFNVSVVWRNFEKDYNALEPNALAESSTINNERGIFFGMEFLLHRDWKLRAYADFWKHPWLKFNIDSPSHGREYIARLDFTKKRKLNAYIQYTYENKLFNASLNDDKLKIASDQIRHRFRVHLSQNVNKNLELRTRFEISKFQNPEDKEKGYLFYQDVIYKPFNSPFSLTARMALFDTEGFDSRIFAFENSVLYDFAIPSYFYQGFRYYINLRHDINYNMTAELRFARTHFTDRNEISSGNEQIDGDTKSEVKAQLRYIF